MSAAALHANSPFSPEFGKRGELRQAVGNNGRAHLDRWLPFIVLHRSADPFNSIARKVAVNSPAYLIWSPEDDVAAEAAFTTIASELHKRFRRLLLIEVADAAWETVPEGSQKLPTFDIEIAAAGNSDAVPQSFAQALNKVRIDLRKPTVTFVASGRRPVQFDAYGGAVERLSVAIPQIHRESETTFYPQITRELAAAFGDALLQAACTFMAESGAGAPAHFRSLGRSAFLAAALEADKRLDKVARSFDFLLSVSPINSGEAMERFFASGETDPPKFRYRPLTIDPDAAKRDLYAVDLSIIEDPLLERLLSEKRQEIDHQLTMLSTRNSAAFQAASLLHYGTVSSRLLADAQSILSKPRPRKRAGELVGAIEVANEARSLVAKYQAVDDSFDPAIEIRDDVGSLLVSGRKLMIASNTSVLRSRVDALLAHEVSVHLLTHFNGAAQSLSAFRTGLAQYEGVQEGLGVFAEWAVGGLSAARLRLLAGRVVAVNSMLDGAGFVDVYRHLVDTCGLPRKASFDVTTRVFRSGGFAKDQIYLKGFQEITGFVAAGAALDPLWIGKIAGDHLEAVDELIQRNLVRPPVFRPEFLQRENVKRRLDRVKGASSLAEILELE